MSTNEIGTSNLDAKLISNLGQAYEINEFLKEDQFILPQFNISSSSRSTSGSSKRISLYRFGISASRKTSLSIIYRVSNLRDKILQFLGQEASRAFRVVLGMRSDSKFDHKAATDRIEHALALDGSHASRREDMTDILEHKHFSVEHFRSDYIKRLILYRRLNSQLRNIQADVLRTSQFLTEPHSADRLRLESLIATQSIAKQAVTAEDVVLSRNAYIAKCSEISKSYLNTGLNYLQSLKTKSSESEQVRNELVEQSCEFIKEMVDNRIQWKVDARLPLIKSSSNNIDLINAKQSVPFAISSSEECGNRENGTPSMQLVQRYSEPAEQIISSLEETISKWKHEHLQSDELMENDYDVKLDSGRRARSPKRRVVNGEYHNSPSPSRNVSPTRSFTRKIQLQSQGILQVGGINHDLNNNKNKSNSSNGSSSNIPDAVDDETRDDILHEYADWVLTGQQQFENLVSQSMSRCIKMTLTALENKFMRVTKGTSGHNSMSGSSGSSSASFLKTNSTNNLQQTPVERPDDDSAALELVCDHWNPSKHLMWQIKHREDELKGARKHFENVRTMVTDEVRDRLQAIYNYEIQQQMSAITRVQLRLKKTKDGMKKHQMSLDAYQSLKM